MEAVFERLANAKIFIDDELCGTIPKEVIYGKKQQVECSKPITGTGIKIVKDPLKPSLEMAEVKVYGVRNCQEAMPL